jgi:hypothetical protein
MVANYLAYFGAELIVAVKVFMKLAPLVSALYRTLENIETFDAKKQKHFQKIVDLKPYKEFSHSLMFTFIVK